MKIFILEDDPARVDKMMAALNGKGHEITVVDKVGTAIHKYAPPYPDLVLLDHDLGGKQFVAENEFETGSQFVRWLVETHPDNKSTFLVHSYNPVGADNMVALLQKAMMDVVRIPFGDEVLYILKLLP